jgi:hypothetical protein
MKSFLDLSKLEASPTIQVPTLELNFNADIRRHLSLIERSAFAIPIIRAAFEHQKELQHALSRVEGRLATDPYHQYIVGFSSYRDDFPDFVQAFLMIRKFVVGFHHTSILPVTYAALHDLSTADLLRYGDVGKILTENCLDHWAHIGIERRTHEDRWWREDTETRRGLLKEPWAFAVNVIEYERSWRPNWSPGGIRNVETNLAENLVRIEYSRACERFGERVKLMYGGDEIPWTQERVRQRECIVRGLSR